MSVLIDSDARILVQGITGRAGSFHARSMIEYGSKVVAGVTPGHGGESFEGVPVFETVEEAMDATGATASAVFVPAPFAADAVMEAAEAKLDLVVVITEGIPTLDMIRARDFARARNVRLVGPNCPGVITPGASKIGIMPGYIHKPGRVGVVSRSGTLTYEAVWQLTSVGLGQSTCIGIGGDPVPGTTMAEAVELFRDDPATEALLLIGEIGGTAEEEAAEIFAAGYPKPVGAFVAGLAAPPRRRMGHAGAIASGSHGGAEAKISCLEAVGVAVVRNPAEMGATVKRLIEG
jgi:succinyl-CoA synthetase alpha subunit